MSSSLESELRPGLVFRIAFAGTRDLPESGPARHAVESALQGLFSAVSGALIEVKTQAHWVRQDRKSRVGKFYGDEMPEIRVVTGLAEGGDELAMNVTRGMRAEEPQVTWTPAAVLPFPKQAYRESRKDPAFRDRFDAMYEACSYVVELDGIYDADVPLRRHAAYRGQSAVLLRQADLLIALADAAAETKAGGTSETLRMAADMGLPCVFLDSKTAALRFLGPGEVSADPLAHSRPEPSEDVRRKLRDEVLWTVAAPDMAIVDHPTAAHSPSEDELLKGYFEPLGIPPYREGRRQSTRLERHWNRFKARFARAKRPTIREPMNPCENLRRRAADLSAHYAGRYRGAFLQNYRRAVWAVLIASVSFLVLVLSAIYRESVSHTLEIAVLLALGIAKLTFVLRIFITTRRGNAEGWNDRAVAYRYLSERLRAMAYLPLLGSYRPPAAESRRGVRLATQSAVDWLFDAIVRQTPVQSYLAPPEGPDERPLEALAQVREGWLETQLRYHEDNAHTMKGMFHDIERQIHWLSNIVLAVVALDLLGLALVLTHLWPGAHAATPFFVLIAAVLPAAIAGWNGVRFQTECRSLADGSEVTAAVLRSRIKQVQALEDAIRNAKAATSTDPGAWIPDALRCTEAVAEDMAREAAQWSVLYSKEIRDT